jgi:uncharacterized repeat protein (TIGR03987 family)
MPTLLITSIICMISALTLYSVGVWSEKLSGRLKAWHTALFIIGFVFDTTGTTLMGIMAGKMDFDLHGITGALAIFLMLSHAIWAVIVLLTRKQKMIQNFHKLSIFVWSVWLVPFLTGMVGAMLH